MNDKRAARTVLLLALGLVGSAANADCRLLSVADVGERGRSNVDTNGVAAVQFVQGDKSVTLSLRSTRKDGRDNLDAISQMSPTHSSAGKLGSGTSLKVPK